jgi:hypothetical protein
LTLSGHQVAGPRGSRGRNLGVMFSGVRSHGPKSAEAVFIGGNGFRVIGVIKALEETLDRPVLSANQVAFWCALPSVRHTSAYCQLWTNIRVRSAEFIGWDFPGDVR